ncbi:hypothetical protein FJT64_010912 [Amphibalanus amphitrite]|uniref:Uncharacterized protein n=1 Tax=Amphibalanus amphitrite TaxID=1232801 RepID=A0A6A4VK78_AMPAM|nr:hypothetical protein FJT64_010912 [Amphibalanus amphitrite]
MSKQNLSTLSDIPEEKTTSVSADSLENTSQGTAGRDKPNNGLNVSHSSNVEFPSFNNILSSSHCDVASVSKSATLVGSLETHHHHHKVSALFISEDAPTAPHKPHVVQRYLEITQDDETRICKHNQSAEVAVSSPRSKNTGVPESSPANTAKQEAKRDQSRTKAERQSRIPVAVRSLPVIARLRQNIEKQTEGTKEPEKDPPKVKESDTTPQVAAKAPKAVERCRSHHIIDRPEKDFIQLNKQGEFRRTKTYHHLHLERRHKEKAPDSVTSKPSNSEVGEATAATPSDAPGSGERQTAGSAAGPAGPIRDSEVSGQTPGARSSPRVSEPRSPRAGSEGSGGRRSSRIPVRAGPSTSPRRRHQSHESPRDHVSRHESHVSRRDFHTFGRGLEGSQLEFHESRLSYGSSESELLLVPKLHLQTSQPSLIDVNDNRRLLAGPRKVYTPPDRVPMPHRHVPYQPNLKPYPRQYVKLGKLGPDPAAVKARARVANSLSRLRTLTDQLVTGTAAVPAVDEVPRLLRRDDSCPTLGASSDMDSEYSTDSLIAPSRPTVVSMGRSYGSTSPRGRGLFPPTRGAPGCRRPMSHCSRGVGPERPGAATQPVAEDFFFDTCGGHGECACGDQSCSPPLSPHRRPVVTRGTQSVVETPLNETFVVHKNPLVVDIGMPVGAGRTRRSSPRRRLGGLSPDSLAGSPPQDWRMGRPDEVPSHASVLHMMRERHLRDKRRVDAIISGSITRM